MKIERSILDLLSNEDSLVRAYNGEMRAIERLNLDIAAVGGIDVDCQAKYDDLHSLAGLRDFHEEKAQRLLPDIKAARADIFAAFNGEGRPS